MTRFIISYDNPQSNIVGSQNNIYYDKGKKGKKKEERERQTDRKMVYMPLKNVCSPFCSQSIRQIDSVFH